MLWSQLRPGRERLRRAVLRASSFMNRVSAPYATQFLSSKAENRNFDPLFISDWAKRFDSAYFVDGFRELVNARHGVSRTKLDRQA